MYGTDSDRNPNVLNVERNSNGKRWLNTDYANPDDIWNLDNRIVFRLRCYRYFSPGLLGEFCFRVFPYQPPSMRPIFISCSEILA
ncbi:MAG: hypothetical protein UY30_C0004G0016 [Parcubacteria group bacterium GW2011_GWB1_48_6]|nr:MAG: hypothetical protein UY30_C0004G0016 [Parcubacteria group bacterium GW2011_GWB1_48_6]